LLSAAENSPGSPNFDIPGLNSSVGSVDGHDASRQLHRSPTEETKPEPLSTSTTVELEPLKSTWVVDVPDEHRVGLFVEICALQRGHSLSGLVDGTRGVLTWYKDFGTKPLADSKAKLRFPSGQEVFVPIKLVIPVQPGDNDSAVVVRGPGKGRLVKVLARPGPAESPERRWVQFQSSGSSELAQLEDLCLFRIETTNPFALPKAAPAPIAGPSTVQAASPQGRSSVWSTTVLVDQRAAFAQARQQPPPPSVSSSPATPLQTQPPMAQALHAVNAPQRIPSPLPPMPQPQTPISSSSGEYPFSRASKSNALNFTKSSSTSSFTTCKTNSRACGHEAAWRV
jgi:hypothetical protein